MSGEDIKQLLNEVEQDMRNYKSRGLCYQTEALLIIPHILREPNSITVFLLSENILNSILIINTRAQHITINKAIRQ